MGGEEGPDPSQLLPAWMPTLLPSPRRRPRSPTCRAPDRGGGASLGPPEKGKRGRLPGGDGRPGWAARREGREGGCALPAPGWKDGRAGREAEPGKPPPPPGPPQRPPSSSPLLRTNFTHHFCAPEAQPGAPSACLAPEEEAGLSCLLGAPCSPSPWGREAEALPGLAPGEDGHPAPKREGKVEALLPSGGPFPPDPF